MKTESEARNSWCPFARVIHGQETGTPFQVNLGSAPAGNRIQTGGGKFQNMDGAACIVASCMAWRWSGWPTKWGGIATNPADEDKTGERVGYCGLGGVPKS